MTIPVTPSLRSAPELMLVTLLRIRAARAAEGRALVVRLRAAELAAGRPWPPPIPAANHALADEVGRFRRPLVWRGGLTPPGGCFAQAGPPCVPVTRGQWRCPACRTVTPVPEPVVGQRLTECACFGDGGVVCVHPVDRAPHRPARPR